jgi:hypothetical protein
MARALAEREYAMEQRARSLVEEAIASGHAWLRPLGAPPSALAKWERWLREVSTVAAYRDRWHIEGQGPLGPAPDRANHEQTAQRAKALSAGKWARAISTPAVIQPNTALISSPFGGVIDVASVCFSLRGGRVIPSGVFDVVDVADADLEMNSCDVDIGAQAAVRSELVTGLSAVPLGMAGHHAGPRVTSCVGPCVGSQPDHRRGRL